VVSFADQIPDGVELALFRPPYVGVLGWVGVVRDAAPDWGGVKSLVRDAYVHVAPRKVLALL
jgi:hypothetical protein